jgi:hypothetical protein
MDPSGALTYFKCHATARAFARMVDWQLWCDVGLGTSHLLFLPVLLFLPGCVGPSASSKKGGQLKLLGRWSFPCRPQARSVGICVVNLLSLTCLKFIEIRDFCCQTKTLIRVANDKCGCELTQITCFRVRAWFHVSLLNSCKKLEREAAEERGRKVLSHEARRRSHLFHAGFLEQRVPSVSMSCQCVLAATSYDYASWSACAVATALLEARSTNF